MASHRPSSVSTLAWMSVVGSLLVGCPSPPPPLDDDSTGGSAGSEGGEGGGSEVALAVNQDVDILFVIDNSGSMGPKQGLLSANFPSFINVLEAEDVHASYRIGVTTTDNGNPWCGTTSPEAGNLQMVSCRSRPGEFVFNGNPPADATAVACTDLCQFDQITTLPTSTEYDPGQQPRPWLENSDGVTNLAQVDGVTPTTVEALQCVVPQGIAGCGFESHLESMYKAFLRSAKEEEDEYGFLRSNAILAVVIVSDEIDCSYNNDYQSIFLPADQGGNPAVFWSDPMASAPTSAVCWRAGVVCSGGPGTYDTCAASNKDVNGNTDVPDEDAVLHPLARYVDFVQELEESKQEISPGQEVVVSLITGVPVGYESGAAELTYADASGAEQSDFGIAAGCVNNAVDPPFMARPPVREREFAEAFEVGGQRNLYSVCMDDYSPALDAIANAIRDQIRPSCMSACVADTNPLTPEVDPVCTLVQRAPEPGGGGIDETDVPKCNGDGSVPDGAEVCHVVLVADDMSEYCTDQGWNLEFRIVRRAGDHAPAGTSITATCQLSQQKNVDCPSLP